MYKGRTEELTFPLPVRRPGFVGTLAGGSLRLSSTYV